MTFIVSTAAIVITAPQITLSSLTTNSVQVNLLISSSGSSNIVYTLAIIQNPGGANPVTTLVNPPSFPYQATSLASGTLYGFILSASDTEQNIYRSPPSVQVQATTGSTVTVPGQVTGLTATAVGANTIALSWNTDIGATGYTITRNSSVIATGVSATSYNDAGLLASTTYTYTVAGSNSAGTGPQSASATATTPAATIGLSLKIGTGAQKGKFVDQNGNIVGGAGAALIGPEEPWGYKDGTGRSMAGWGKVTTAQYLSANTTNIATLASAAHPAVTIKWARLLFNSALWMAATGRDPQLPSSPGCMTNNYYAAGTDSAGHALYCGGPGGGPGSGIGSEQFGDPTIYRNNMKAVVAALIGAGYYVLLDLHFGTPVLPNGQCVMPAGQSAFPSIVDQTCLVSMAQVFGSQAYGPGGGAIIFGLYNEIYGTNTGATGLERAVMGSQIPGTFAFPTAATGSATSSLSNGRGTAVGFTMFDNFGDNNNYVICGGGQTSQSVGFQSIIYAMRATGATNILCVGNQSYNTQISSYSAIGGNMVVNDTLVPGQLCIDQHYDTGATLAQFTSLQNAGMGIMSTEMNSISSTNGGYQGWLNNGWLYCWWGGWTDFSSGINNGFPPSTNCFLSGIMTGKDQNGNAQAYGGTPWRTASVVPNGSN